MTKFRTLVNLRIAQIVLEDYGSRVEEIMDCIANGEVMVIYKEATEWVEHTIEAILAAPDNPYKDLEEVAAAILEKIKGDAGCAEDAEPIDLASGDWGSQKVEPMGGTIGEHAR